MTTIQITYNHSVYTLSDEASQSSYGEPVLVGPDGTQYRAGETVSVTDGNDIYRALGGQPEPATAFEIVQRGEHIAADECNFRTDNGLTDYGRDTAAMFERFCRQKALPI